MTSHARCLLITVVGSAMLIACQTLADEHTDAPPLAVMRGTLSLGAGTQPPEGDTRLAIMWGRHPPYDPDPLSHGPPSPPPPQMTPCGTTQQARDALVPRVSVIGLGFAEQALALQAKFPFEFMFKIDEPPPPEALQRVVDTKEPGMLLAQGDLIVYRDGNRNGKLDTQTYTRQSPDEILASSRASQSFTSGDMTTEISYSLEYANRKFEPLQSHGALWESAPPDLLDSYRRLEPGYNLVRDIYRHSKTTDLSATNETARVPLDTLIPLVLSADINPDVLCEEHCWAQGTYREPGRDPTTFACPADPIDLPGVDARAQYDIQTESLKSWSYADGQTSFGGSDDCWEESTGRRFYKWTRTSEQACAGTQIDCDYTQDALPAGAALPCIAYHPSESNQ